MDLLIMIFVTLGTQDKSFVRLLKSIEVLIESGVITEEVIVQAGFTQFSSKSMKIFDYVSMDEFNAYIDRCSLLITHGGVGSILTGCLAKKKVLAVARREKYNEHENNHQIQIVDEFDKRGYIIGCLDADDLLSAYERVLEFTPVEYHPNNLKICEMIVNFIENNV